jgi:MFS transporter, MHS family, alpha-ketoglutarate permease
MPTTAESKVAPAPVKHKLPLRTLIAASSGNAIEWFDWTVYSVFAIYFSTQFFPSGNEPLALINTYAAFALAFFLRPLGGILLGRFADLRGRKPAMILTVSLMAGGSAVIGLLPTYEQVGWLAPILLLLARCAQGLSLGGEVSNANSYLSEVAPNERRARYSAFYYISTGTAVLVATLFGYFLTQLVSAEDLSAWGWRIPFFVGGFLALIALWLRRSMPESQKFEENKGVAKKIRNPFVYTIKKHPRAVLTVVGLTMLNTLAYYTFFSALTPFATKQRGADPADVFLALSIGIVFFIVLQYPMGWLADKFGRRPMLFIWSILTIVTTVPLSLMINDSLPSLIFVFCAGLAVYSIFSAMQPALYGELFPTAIRATGIGIWLNITVAVFGGTASLVITLLGSWGMATAFFWYVTAAAVVALVTSLSVKETKGISLS